VAYLGFTVGDGDGAWVLGVGAPQLAAIVWAALVAPRARWPVTIPTRVVIELVLFGVPQAPSPSTGSAARALRALLTIS
jgi:hypothetical protein